MRLLTCACLLRVHTHSAHSNEGVMRSARGGERGRWAHQQANGYDREWLDEHDTWNEIVRRGERMTENGARWSAHGLVQSIGRGERGERGAHEQRTRSNDRSPSNPHGTCVMIAQSFPSTCAH